MIKKFWGKDLYLWILKLVMEYLYAKVIDKCVNIHGDILELLSLNILWMVNSH